jgi:hypothetical protein
MQRFYPGFVRSKEHALFGKSNFSVSFISSFHFRDRNADVCVKSIGYFQKTLALTFWHGRIQA